MDVHDKIRMFSFEARTESFSNARKSTRHNHLLTAINPSWCNICCKSLGTNGKLIIHMQLHAGGKPYECDICHEAYVSRCSLKKHVKRMHVKKQPFECIICNKSFITSNQRIFHWRRVHVREKLYDVKQFKCQVCDVFFADSISLIKHRRIHRKPCMCKVCGRTFNEPTNLNRHMQTHVKDELNKCEECDMIFANSVALMGHWIQTPKKVATKKDE